MIYKEPHLIQLEKCIRLTASKSDQYKTILVISPTMYQVVTRVNHHTTKIWLELAKEKAKVRLDIELPNKINWLIATKYYRRKIEDKLNNKPNDDRK